MKILKDNPNLSLDAIYDIVENPFTIIVNPKNYQIAMKLTEILVNKKFKFYKVVNENITLMSKQDAINNRLLRAEVLVDVLLKPDEYILITEKDIYYSKGDNSNT